jgi:aminoglycoside phosphotransferase (APT) family kinase protein
VKDELGRALGTRIAHAVRLAGGASKEAWAVETGDGRELLVRRAGGGVIHEGTLSLEHEFEILRAAHEAGVTVPEPVAYLGEVEGREAFVMERVHGETIGRRIVQKPELEAARRALPLQMANELARIHAIPRDRVPFLVEDDPIERFYRELDLVGEPHPAIELGLLWVRERLPRGREPTVVHGDFRLGNLAVDKSGLASVLDWEFAHVGDPAEDVAWPLVRAWRFGIDGKRLGGIAAVEPYLERYCTLTGREIPLSELDVWEVFGNVKWAIGALRQGRRHLSGDERSVELAILGRLAAEMEYELLDLLEKAVSDTGVRNQAVFEASVSDTATDRPTAGELAAAVREFLESEILPTLDDHRLRFRTLVAMNALGIVERESPPPPEADWELARRIRAGDVPDDAVALLKGLVRQKLLVVNPSYLERY